MLFSPATEFSLSKSIVLALALFFVCRWVHVALERVLPRGSCSGSGHFEEGNKEF